MQNLRKNFSFLATLLAVFFLCFGKPYGFTHFYFFLHCAIVFACLTTGMLRGSAICLVGVVLGFIVAQKSVDLPSQLNPRNLGSNYYLQVTFDEIILIMFLLHFHAKLAKDAAETKRRSVARAVMSRKAALAEVMGKLAHEVNNPLAIVHASFLRFQAERLRGGESQAMLEHMGAAQDRIQSVLRNLKTFSEGDLMEPMQELSATNLLREMENQSTEMARSHGVTLQLEYPAQDLNVRCRPGQIHFVLSALVENACESMLAAPRSLVLRLLQDESWNFGR